MSKSIQLLEMINLIKNKPGISIVELAGEMGRSQRSIFRWLSEIGSQMQMDVKCVNGGYYLCDGNDQGIKLTNEEMMVVRLSLKSSLFGDGSPIKKHAESAWKKIKKAISSSAIMGLPDACNGHHIHITSDSSLQHPEIIDAIEKALNSHKQIKAVYRSHKSDMIKDYILDPYSIVFRRHSWYLLAYCQERKQILQFKLARFQSVVETGIRFEVPVDFSADEYFSNSWEAWSGDDEVKVRVKFSPRVAKMIAESKRHPTQIAIMQLDGSVIFEATVSGIEEISIWILGYGKEAEVLAPRDLKDHIIEHAQGILDIYNKKL